MEDHKTKLDKEYDQLMQTFSKDLDKLRFKQQTELERLVCKLKRFCCFCTLLRCILPFKLTGA